MMTFYSFYSINTRIRILFIFLALWVIAIISYLVIVLNPEIGLVYHSTCNRPVQNWNGKIWNIPVWSSGLMEGGRPTNHNIHFRVNSTGDRRRLLLFSKEGGKEEEEEEHAKEEKEKDAKGEWEEMNRIAQRKPKHIIVWGTHHRTGTYLAQKIFSVICAKMEWCCIFHPTRDSIDAIKYSLSTETVRVLGHNQWIWHPEEVLGVGVKYKFVHFYRKPLKKIVSGYRYHKEGSESWTRSKTKKFANLCSSKLLSLASSSSSSSVSSSSSSSFSSSFSSSLLKPLKNVVIALNRSIVVEHCSAVHLCETCCRREHQQQISNSESEYFLRSQKEYNFFCKHLGSTKGSLKDKLLGQSIAEGMLTESALDFYESLRMAKIVNQTWHNPDTLNVDLDDLIFFYKPMIRKVLRHIELDLNEKDFEKMASELDFFDTRNSLIYRLSMTNLFINHVDTTTSSEQMEEMMSDLANNEEFKTLYKPVMDLHNH